MRVRRRQLPCLPGARPTRSMMAAWSEVLAQSSVARPQRARRGWFAASVVRLSSALRVARSSSSTACGRMWRPVGASPGMVWARSGQQVASCSLGGTPDPMAAASTACQPSERAPPHAKPPARPPPCRPCCGRTCCPAPHTGCRCTARAAARRPAAAPGSWWRCACARARGGEGVGSRSIGRLGSAVMLARCWLRTPAAEAAASCPLPALPAPPRA
jgi:hypothetical protein